MSEEDTNFKIDLDSGAFISHANEALESIKKLGEKENLSGLISGMGEMVPLLGVLGVAFFAFKESLEAVFDAEKVIAINQQFEILTKNAGVMTDTLREGLVEAGKGLVDDTDLMESANKALVKLEVGAEKLPQILELARKASQINGQTMLQNFEAINNAVATGNTRQLRNLNIIIDQKKAYKEYAASIGESVDSLTLAGRQQAVLNATLDIGNKNLAGVNGDLKRATNAWQQLKVALSEIGETFSLLFNKIAGPSISETLRVTGEKFRDWNNLLKATFSEGSEQVDAQAKVIKKKLNEISEEIWEKEQKAREGGGIFFNKELNDVEIKRLTDLENIYKEKLAAINKSKKEGSETSEESTGKGADVVDQDIKLKNKLKTEKEMLDIEAKRIKEEEDLETDALKLSELRAQEEKNIIAKAENETKEITRQLREGEITDKQVAAARIAEIERKSQNDIKAMRIKSKDDAIKADKELMRQEETSMKGFSGGWKKATDEANKNFKNMATLGSKSNAMMTKSFSAGFKALGDGSKDAADAMGEAFLGEIGQEAIARGEFLIASSIFPPNPLGFAAGGALIALGSKLGSMGSAPSSGGASGGIGYDSGPANSPMSAAASNTQNNKNVNLVFQGPILGDATTARYITDMVRNSADAQAFTVQSVGGGF